VSQADPVVERWQMDVGRIASEVIEMHHNRNVFRRVNEIAVARSLPPSSFFGYLTATYGVTQVAAVRRQADPGKHSVCLYRLLDEISRKRQRLSREWFFKMYEPDLEESAAAGWELFAGQGGQYVDPKLVQADLRDLTTAAKRAKDWADERVAHTGREPAVRTPTLGELDGAIDTIGRLFQRYNLLLRGRELATLAPDPAAVEADLNALFGRAWIR
jgi:hypothetical protein